MLVHNLDKEFARMILEYSVELQPGEKVMIQLNGLNGISLVRALVERSREMGAHPFLEINDSETQRLLLEAGNEEFWKLQTSVDQLPLMRQMDAFVGIRATPNIFETSRVSADAQKSYAEHFLQPVHFQERVNNTKWCIMRYPSEAFAMNARMPTSEFIDFFYRCCLFDYAQLARDIQPLEDRLRKTREIRLKGNGTDITFSVEGQNWIPCVGKRNIPDGELFSSPILNSVQGVITYAPTVYQGKPFEYVKLIVRDGVVTEYDSSDNDSLRQILDTDEGARRFGEFSFGLNPEIRTPMYDILFDEKIYGSNHLTLGNDYEIAPNGNKSSIHWDLICIGADVYLDGQRVRKGRLFTDPELVHLNYGKTE